MLFINSHCFSSEFRVCEWYFSNWTATKVWHGYWCVTTVGRISIHITCFLLISFRRRGFFSRFRMQTVWPSGNICLSQKEKSEKQSNVTAVIVWKLSCSNKKKKKYFTQRRLKSGNVQRVLNVCFSVFGMELWVNNVRANKLDTKIGKVYYWAQIPSDTSFSYLAICWTVSNFARIRCVYMRAGTTNINISKSFVSYTDTNFEY